MARMGDDARVRAARRNGGRAAAALAVLLAASCASLRSPRAPETAAAAPQAEFPRVAAARRRQALELSQLFRAARVAYPAPLFVMAFKRERTLELWGFSASRGRYVRVAAYPVLAASGDLGPKRRAWDHQVPEGFYHLVHLNPESLYHLSLQLDYPNRSDRLLGDQADAGSDIFIHGDRVSDGCLPIGDRAVEQLYLAVLDSRAAGHPVPMAIFPCRFSDGGCASLLRQREAGRRDLAALWDRLAAGFELFERTGRPPRVTVDGAGRYVLGGPAIVAGARRAEGPDDLER